VSAAGFVQAEGRSHFFRGNLLASRCRGGYTRRRVGDLRGRRRRGSGKVFGRRSNTESGNASKRDNRTKIPQSEHERIYGRIQAGESQAQNRQEPEFWADRFTEGADLMAPA
jgi:hypothetical protein